MAYELLLPAKDYKIGLNALYLGADAIYFGLNKFGARAYATNFSIEEAKNISLIAKLLNKKTYVTVNTIIKEDELNDAYSLIDEIAKTNITGLILADYAIFNYIKEKYPTLEAHISTQAGLKNLNDVLYFEEIGAKRAVLAREVSIDTIKEIKERANIEIEAFIHGALCVCYSGSCFLSSILSLRSGNRGRCSQNCRREYNLYEDNKLIDKNKYLLSMKDLNVGPKIKDLIKIGVDSLKIEGRMKNSDYVFSLVNYYKNIVSSNKVSDINHIFHRNFTKGFILNEDRGNILDKDNPSNVGKYVGIVVKYQNDILYLKTNEELNIGDRIRFEGKERQYLTIDNLTKENDLYKIQIDFKYSGNKEVFKMIDAAKSDISVNNNILPLNLNFYLKENEKLKLIVRFNNHNYSFYSDNILEKSNKIVADKDYIYEQFNKLNDTPFYINEFNVNGDTGLFIAKSSLNQLRRSVIEYIYNLYNENRIPQIIKDKKLDNNYLSNELVYATCSSEEQYKLLTSLGIKTYYKNHENFYDNHYEIIDNEVLVSSFGSIYKLKKNYLTLDYNFNLINSDAIYYILKQNSNIKHLTLGYEVSSLELKKLSESFKDNYGFKAPIDFIVYGKQKLMRIKACPLKCYGKCGICHNHQYEIGDGLSRFSLIKDGCNHDIINNISLNLVDELDNIIPYVSRIRLDFTNENKEEIKEIINELNKKLNGKKVEVNNRTKGYFKRSVL